MIFELMDLAGGFERSIFTEYDSAILLLSYTGLVYPSKDASSLENVNSSTSTAPNTIRYTLNAD